MWTGLIWLMIGVSVGLLWTRWWTVGFHKMLLVCLTAEGVLGSWAVEDESLTFVRNVGKNLLSDAASHSWRPMPALRRGFDVRTRNYWFCHFYFLGLFTRVSETVSETSCVVTVEKVVINISDRIYVKRLSKEYMCMYQSVETISFWKWFLVSCSDRSLCFARNFSWQHEAVSEVSCCKTTCSSGWHRQFCPYPPDIPLTGLQPQRNLIAASGSTRLVSIATWLSAVFLRPSN